MYKSILALFFSLSFLALISGPTVVSLIDTDYDVSFLLDTNEEEEKNESKEASKDLKVNMERTVAECTSTFFTIESPILRAYSNTYCSMFSELNSPPPEHITA